MDPERYEGLTRAQAREQMQKDMVEARAKSQGTIKTLYQAAEALRNFGRLDLAGDLDTLAGETLDSLTKDFPQLEEAMAKLIDAL